MTGQLETGLLQAYDALKAGNPELAKTLLTDVLAHDLENEEIFFTLKCIDFWRDKLAKGALLITPFERGENIVSNWKHFSNLFEKEGKSYEKSMYSVKQGVFKIAMEHYQSMLRDNPNAQDWEVFRKIGLCYKMLGVYETALQFLEKANSLVADSAPVLSEMADCYALCGEERTAKVFFREAFFIDAQKIDLSLLDSPLIVRLVEQTASFGYSGQSLQEWIPVYGVLLGVFTVKRELRALEIGKLKQGIYTLENELKEEGNDSDVLVPRLINHYFWLIDHYVTVHEDRARINETLLKIKLLDKVIFEKIHYVM